MSGYILSAFLTLPITPDAGYANPEQEAMRRVSQALYKEFELDKTVKRLEKKYVDEDIKEYVGYTGIVVRIVTEKRVTYTWRF